MSTRIASGLADATGVRNQVPALTDTAPARCADPSVRQCAMCGIIQVDMGVVSNPAPVPGRARNRPDGHLHRRRFPG